MRALFVIILVLSSAVQAEAKAYSVEGSDLVLTLEEGKKVKFRNVPEEYPNEMAEHQYVKFIDRLNHHLIHVNYYEGDDYRLVSNRTGRVITIDSPPEISPDGKRIVTVSFSAAHNFNGVVVYDWTPHGYVKAAKHEIEGVYYNFVRWEGNERIQLKRFTYDSTACNTGGLLWAPAVMKQDGGQWKLEYGKIVGEDCTVSP